MSEYCRAVEKMNSSASDLAQHAWEHDHDIGWTSTCVLGTESHYHSRLSRQAINIRRQLNRDRGTLPDVYDPILLQLMVLATR